MRGKSGRSGERAQSVGERAGAAGRCGQRSGFRCQGPACGTDRVTRGAATALSDWDFTVTAAEFEAVRDALPSLTAPLRPVVAQWDRLSRHWCYMMILAGPATVDLLLGRPHPIAPPWLVSASTLTPIDDHFWDWSNSQDLWIKIFHAASG
jgi:hypothetical protein